mmetsp:Transcript_20436/g.45858  ORF Transcript_20436/g.45858 Transcript_20436/m.45858 type:complete len:426 (+) Transcript_20436:61-1338(+)
MGSRERFVFVVVGAYGSGKTQFVERLLSDGFSEEHIPTIGVQKSPAQFFITAGQVTEPRELQALLPAGGIEVELLEIGGREGTHRPHTREEQADGMIVCADLSSDSAAVGTARVLLPHRMDDYQRRRDQSVADAREKPRYNVPTLLCGTKADLEAEKRNLAGLQKLAQAYGLRCIATSALTGAGIRVAVHTLLLLVLQARSDEQMGLEGPLVKSDQLLQAYSASGHRVSLAPLQRCLEKGLHHRAVHVWICILRSGALLVRQYRPDFPKHPGRWGPSCHGEIVSTGSAMDGCSTETSLEAAKRATREQLGVDAGDIGELTHWFTTSLSDGSCQEMAEVYVLPFDKPAGTALPVLQLPASEAVDWASYVDVFADNSRNPSALFYMDEQYKRQMRLLMKPYVDGNAEAAAFHPREPPTRWRPVARVK